MKKYIAISEYLQSTAKKYAALNNCTTSEQVQYWAEVGKACIDNPDLPTTFVIDSLQSLQLHPFSRS